MEDEEASIEEKFVNLVLEFHLVPKCMIIHVWKSRTLVKI